MRENDLNLQIDEAITFLFRHMGCPVNLAGYYQAKTVISYCVRNRGKAIFLSKEAYPYAAQIHGVNAKQIERNIRNFIEVTWTRGDMKAQHKIFGNTRGRCKNPSHQQGIYRQSDPVYHSPLK